MFFTERTNNKYIISTKEKNLGIFQYLKYFEYIDKKGMSKIRPLSTQTAQYKNIDQI